LSLEGRLLVSCSLINCGRCCSLLPLRGAFGAARQGLHLPLTDTETHIQAETLKSTDDQETLF
jgi:hypothetical protein